jgi:hypothetical protein
VLQIPPRLFTIPEKQQLVPNLRPPESRSDLEGLMRVVNDQVCASMGVPAAVIFEGALSTPPTLAVVFGGNELHQSALRLAGKFSSNSMSQQFPCSQASQN